MERRIATILRYGCAALAACVLMIGCKLSGLLTAIEADVQAAAGPSEYTLTFEVEPADGGTTTPAGTKTWPKNEPLIINATADVSADWQGWTIKSGTGVSFGDASQASTTVTLTQGDATIVANFDLVHCQLSTVAINGTVTPSTPTPKDVLRGKATTISCTPEANYHFSSWSASPQENATFADAGLPSTTVSLTGDATVTATCTNFLWNLTVNHSGTGSTTPSGTSQVPQGSPQGISAVPGGGHSFAGWSITSGSGVSIADPTEADTTVTLSSGNGTITAAFVVTPALQSVNPTSGSTISTAQAITVGFNKNMNPGTLSVSGTLLAPGYTTAWPNAAMLTISPQSAWTGGSMNLSISCRDTDGVLVTGDLSYTVDATAPTISTINYADSSAITKTTALAITFSEPIAQSSPAPSFTGTLMDSGFGAIWSNGNRTVTLSPSTSWPVGSWKTLIVSCSDPYQNPFSSTLQYGILDGVAYVKTSADGGNDAYPGTQTHPKATIRAAIILADALYADAEVRVAEGTFDVTSGSTNVELKEGVDLYGGYDKTNWSVRNKTTTIRDLKTTGGGQTNPNCAVYAGPGITTATIIDGFTIRAGSTASASAGIRCYQSSPTISNNKIYGGLDCADYAFAVHVYDSASPYIGPGNTITGGTSPRIYSDWGAMGVWVNDDCSPSIVGNTISGGGGATTLYATGVFIWTSTVLVARNTISGGTATTGSYGISYRYGYTNGGSIRNNTISGGSAPKTYGAFIYDSAPDIRNNTIDGGAATGSDSDAYAVHLNGGTAYHPNVENNHIFATSGIRRRGVQFYNSCTPDRLYNNNFFDCTSLLIGDGNNYTTIAAVNALAYAEGNIAEDISASFGADYIFTGSLSGVTFDTAGLDGVSQGWGFTDDKNGITRTGSGGIGWSIGAYEYN